MKELVDIWNRLRRCLGQPRSCDPEFQTVAHDIGVGICQLAKCEAMSSAVFHRRAILRLREFRERLGTLADGRLLFESTETWRTVYEEVLQECRTRRYLSVALIRSDDYWRDAPGETSLRFNFELVARGFYVHRIFIVDEFFWPRTARTPSTRLFQWIYDQQQRGVEVSLIRLSDLSDEPALASDFGIYGHDAVGRQQTDYEGRTVQYEIAFGQASVAAAEEQWSQLVLFAKPFDEIILVN